MKTVVITSDLSIKTLKMKALSTGTGIPVTKRNRDAPDTDFGGYPAGSG